MLFLMVGVVVFALFTPFVLLAGAKREEDQRMAARFAMLESRSAGGLSSIAIDELLKLREQSGGWLQPVFQRLCVALRLDELLLQADSQSTTRQLLLMCVAVGVTTVFMVFLVFPAWPVELIAALVAGYSPLFALKVRRRRRVLAMEMVLPEVIDMMSRALRAGHSLPASLGMIAEQAPEPAKAEFSEVFRKQRFGLPLRDSLMELLARVPSQDLRVLITGILVQRDTGGNLTQILDRTSAVIRERIKLQGDIRVHTAQGRMTGWILCLLPVGMLLMINMINPGYSRTLTDDPLGRKLLYGGVALLAIGAFLIRRIVGRIEV